MLLEPPDLPRFFLTRANDKTARGDNVRTPVAAVGTATFFVLARGAVAGLVPWWLTGWRTQEPLPSWAWAPVRVAGAVLLTAGVIVLVLAFVRFVTEGVGTPAPVAPTEHLVIGAPYRYVRNPMYLSVVATIVGQALVFGQSGLLLYAAAVAPVPLSDATTRLATPPSSPRCRTGRWS